MSERVDRPERYRWAQPPAEPTPLRRPRIRTARAPWSLRLDVARLVRRLWWLTGALVVLDVAASAAAAGGLPYSLTRFFDGDDKTNVPTAYKTTTLLAATLLLLALRSHARWAGDPFARGWLLLGGVAGFAFVDESVYLHQTISHVLHEALHTTGVLRFAWVLVYAPAALAVAVVLARYLRHLAPDVRRPVLLGGLVYGFGAMGMEPVKSLVGDGSDEGSLAFKLVAAASDSVELVGLTLLVVAVLRELARRATTVPLDLAAATEPGTSPTAQPAAAEREAGEPSPGERTPGERVRARSGSPSPVR